MAHQIFGKRFFNNSRTPAWHGIGFNVPEDETYTATQALEMVDNYRVTLEPLTTQINGVDFETGYSAIMRHPTVDDPKYVMFGSPVSNNYELIDTNKAVEIWDNAVGNSNGTISLPVETLGALREGKELFITSNLGSFDVNPNDTIQNYLFMYSPMYSGNSAVVGITSVRIVCANTLSTGMTGATSKLYFPHTKGAISRITKSLSEIVQRHISSQNIIAEAMQVLSTKKLSDQQFEKAISTIYPDPEQPSEDWDYKFGVPYSVHLEKYEEKLEKINRMREAIQSLYQGAGTSIDAGTAWGGYNAVTEFETYRIGGDRQTIVVSLVNGDRVSKINRAFKVFSSI